MSTSSESIHFENVSLETYTYLEPARLSAAELETDVVFHLMMRHRSTQRGALRAPVYVANIRRLAATTFDVLFTDEDLQPVDTGRPSRVINNIWVPAAPIQLASSPNYRYARIGYFLPYEEALDSMMERWTAAIDESTPSLDTIVSGHTQPVKEKD